MSERRPEESPAEPSPCCQPMGPCAKSMVITLSHKFWGSLLRQHIYLTLSFMPHPFILEIRGRKIGQLSESHISPSSLFPKTRTVSQRPHLWVSFWNPNIWNKTPGRTVVWSQTWHQPVVWFSGVLWTIWLQIGAHVRRVWHSATSPISASSSVLWLCDASLRWRAYCLHWICSLFWTTGVAQNNKMDIYF